MVTTEQIKALEERQQALYTHLHIEDRRLELDEQEALTHDPNFWDDPAKAEAQLKKVAGIKYSFVSPSTTNRGFSGVPSIATIVPILSPDIVMLYPLNVSDMTADSDVPALFSFGI